MNVALMGIFAVLLVIAYDLGKIKEALREIKDVLETYLSERE